MPPDENGWRDREIVRLGEVLLRVEQRLGRIERQLVQLQIRSTLWGAVAGALAAIGPVVFLIWRLG